MCFAETAARSGQIFLPGRYRPSTHIRPPAYNTYTHISTQYTHARRSWGWFQSEIDSADLLSLNIQSIKIATANSTHRTLNEFHTILNCKDKSRDAVELTRDNVKLTRRESHSLNDNKSA